MKKIAIIIAAALALSGCTPPPEGDSRLERAKDETHVVLKELPNGEIVTCVAYSGGYGKSISCNWAEVNQEEG